VRARSWRVVPLLVGGRGSWRNFDDEIKCLCQRPSNEGSSHRSDWHAVLQQHRGQPRGDMVRTRPPSEKFPKGRPSGNRPNVTVYLSPAWLNLIAMPVRGLSLMIGSRTQGEPTQARVTSRWKGGGARLFEDQTCRDDCSRPGAKAPPELRLIASLENRCPGAGIVAGVMLEERKLEGPALMRPAVAARSPCEAVEARCATGTDN